MKIKVLHLVHNISNGGAARSAIEIHNALENEEIYSEVLILEKRQLLKKPMVNFKNYLFTAWLKPRLVNWILKNFSCNCDYLESLSFFDSGLEKFINNSNFDIVNLHWINGETISIRDISNITKPLVWTLHDIWPLSGSKHLPVVNFNRAKKRIFFCFDFDKAIYRKKKALWKNNFNFVCPSKWMFQIAINSNFPESKTVTHIPNPVNTLFWKEIAESDKKFNFTDPQRKNKFTFCFLSSGSLDDINKGFDLLSDTLNYLDAQGYAFNIVNIGRVELKNTYKNVNVSNLSTITNDEDLRLIYSYSDALIMPSRFENFPNVALESLSCSRPVIAFNTGGVGDIISHKRTGFLANNFEPHLLADGFIWIMEKTEEERALIGKECRVAVEKFSELKVSKLYFSLYKKILQNELSGYRPK